MKVTDLAWLEFHKRHKIGLIVIWDSSERADSRLGLFLIKKIIFSSLFSKNKNKLGQLSLEQNLLSPLVHSSKKN